MGQGYVGSNNIPLLITSETGAITFHQDGGILKRTTFNQDISNWVVSKVTNMKYMFFRAIKKLDFMDAMSRFYDLDMSPPQVVYNDNDVYPEHHEDF